MEKLPDQNAEDISQEKLEKLILLLTEALARKDIKTAKLLMKVGRLIALRMK